MARRIGYTVRRLKSGWYQVLVRAEDGKQVGIGTWSSKQDAERAGLKAADRIHDHIWADPRTSDVPVAAWVDQWLARRRATGQHGDRYSTDAANLLRLHINPYPLARRLLTDVRPAHVGRWYEALVAAQRQRLGAPGLIPAKAYRLLHAAFEDAVRDQLVASNPCMIARAGREQSPERPLVTPQQVAQLAATIQPRWSALVLLAAWGALRFGELQRLERRHVDLLHGTVRIEQAKTEAGVRTVHLPAPMVAVLERHLSTYVMPDSSALVFTGERGGALSKNFVRRDFRAAADSIGLDDLHLHDLRHFGGTQTAISGATLREIQARLGHASPAAAMRYQHAAERRGREVADAMGAGWVEPTTTPATVRKIRWA